MSTTTVYPVASSGPDDDVYTARYPHTSDPSGKTLRESGRKILNMAKPKTVPKKYIRTAEGTRPRTRTKVRKEKLAKIRAARESAFMEGGPGSGRHAGSKGIKNSDRAAYHDDMYMNHHTSSYSATNPFTKNRQLHRAAAQAHAKARDAFENGTQGGKELSIAAKAKTKIALSHDKTLD